MKHLLLLGVTALWAFPAISAPYTYGPDNCEFQITFPEKPFIEKKCGQAAGDCAEVVTYTRAIGADSSTNFRVTCNEITSQNVEKYSLEIMEETLNQLAKSNNLTPYNSQSSEKDGYKSASTISLSERDGKPLIYNGQIWIGKKSMFTIESEMLGSQNDEIEKTFVGIMRNTYPKDKKPDTVKAPPESVKK